MTLRFLRLTVPALLLVAASANASSVKLTRGAETATYNDSNATITATQSVDGVLAVRVRGHDGTDFTVALAAARNDRLRRGSYYDAEGATERTGRAPGVEGTWRGTCDETYGGSDVRQVSVDAQRRVATLDATIVYACAPEDEPVVAVVKYKALPFYYWFRADWESYVGGIDGQIRGEDRNKTFLTHLSDIQLRGEPGYFGFNYYVDGQNENWSITVLAIPGVPLAPGTYETEAFSYGYGGGDTHVGMDVSANGRGCRWGNGTLTIHAIRHDDVGRAIGLNAEFVYDCENLGPKVRGTIRHLM
jgi:hypothetical protein